jgi:hypothetical protein
LICCKLERPEGLEEAEAHSSLLRGANLLEESLVLGTLKEATISGLC